MVIIRKVKFGLTATQKWFPDLVIPFDCLTITLYKQVDSKVKISPFFKNEDSYTLHTDLTSTDEEIFRKFNSTVRNEIRRAEKERCIHKFDVEKIIFLSVYNNFATQKGIACQSIHSLNAFGSFLILTSTSINNEVTAVHSYLVDIERKKVRLLHSATIRLSELLDSNMIARSNKFLHYMDMKEFKKEGYEIYDWGGIAFNTINRSLQGINKFKESFGGNLVKQKNLYSPLYYLIMKLFK